MAVSPTRARCTRRKALTSTLNSTPSANLDSSRATQRSKTSASPLASLLSTPFLSGMLARHLNHWGLIRWSLYQCSSRHQERLRKCCTDHRSKFSASKRYLSVTVRSEKSSKVGWAIGSVTARVSSISASTTPFGTVLRAASPSSATLQQMEVSKTWYSRLGPCLRLR